jgi:hypothetical protein
VQLAQLRDDRREVGSKAVSNQDFHLISVQVLVDIWQEDLNAQ